ncbi:metalloregulator ArsR/SmtB family transcription factor [Paenibacillus rhizovicinus]|uniref:Metalloregulator ArsR/SmtB family transcription factor n=1 Tax=Paenibacillus rhizovicinus TaxID=2704463 RepID=A0A6C0P9I0_9BACL|nr:metalloregulator ArsR/SmtB family transcription factor [Paenibacillus rhizovicinus]QHW35224.1 metalloregulator ArsR/SmtB family transcription factor [Paenibacillus rhizovicinus]
MQLDKIVNYHKALADPTRIRMLVLLAEGEMTGQALAEKLCLSPATITHHAAKLRGVSLIHERRDKNAIFFSLDHYFLKQYEGSLSAVLTKSEAAEIKEAEPMDEKNERLKQSVLRNFFTSDGKLKHIPAQLKKKRIVLESLAEKLEEGRSYTEKELNAFIKAYHPDFATIRREFIMHAYLYRETEVYERNPKEMWERWETLA